MSELEMVLIILSLSLTITRDSDMFTFFPIWCLVFSLMITRDSHEALDCFKKYKLEVENQLTRKIKILRTDRGGEYTSLLFKTFCEEHSIKRQFTMPYSP